MNPTSPTPVESPANSTCSADLKHPISVPTTDFADEGADRGYLDQIKHPPLNVLDKDIVDFCQNLFFRQSMIKENMVCPQQTLYGTVLSMEEKPPWMAAILGSAGHLVVFDMHEAQKFDYTRVDLEHQLRKAFEIELNQATNMPTIGAKYDSIDEEYTDKAPAYVDMLQGYMLNKRNREFHSTVHEQRFVVEIPSAIPTERPFLFTGMIDQAGYTSDGDFIERDLKFRDDAFRPKKIELDLDPQMTVYMYALRYGVPACKQCTPQYGEEGELQYYGPCQNCRLKIGTPQWPLIAPSAGVMIWMRDFERRTEDEYVKMIKDPQKIKVEKTYPDGKKRWVIREVVSEKWQQGYKAGDMKGPGFLFTERTPERMTILMSDIVRICANIRSGTFWRSPSKHCGFMCRFRDQCMNAIEQTSTKRNFSAVGGNQVNYDPFDED